MASGKSQALKSTLYLKKPAEMHWLGCNNSVPWLNETKTQIVWPIAKFENFKINLYFVWLPASLL